MILLPVLVLAAITIHTDFEGGSMKSAEQTAPAHFRLAVAGETDQDGRNRQANWYYFRVDGAKPVEDLTLDVVNLPGEYNYKPNQGAITKDTPPVMSSDGVHWRHVETYEYDAAEPKLRLRIKAPAATFWIAHCPPYTNANLLGLRASLQGNSSFHEEVVGKSVDGRPLPLWTISAKGANSKKTVWLFFRQHSWESGSSWSGEGAIRELLSNQGQQLRQNAVWKIFPLCDPDGVARGGVRFNKYGFDLNRNWDVSNAQKMPEITAQRAAIQRWIASGHKIDLLLSLHNTETGEYLEAAPLEKGNLTLQTLAERFFATLSQQTQFAPSQPLRYAETTTTQGKAGRMTVIQGLYRDFQIPGFLIEQRVSYNQRLNRLPEIEDRMRFGKDLVHAIFTALQQSGN